MDSRDLILLIVRKKLAGGTDPISRLGRIMRDDAITCVSRL